MIESIYEEWEWYVIPRMKYNTPELLRDGNAMCRYAFLLKQLYHE